MSSAAAPHARSARRFAGALVLVALVALAVRLATLATVAERDPDGGDPFYYHSQANLVVDGHGFAEPFTARDTGAIVPTAVHPPGYTLWLAASSLVGGRSYLAHKVMSVLAGTLAVVGIGLLGRHLVGPRAGLLAAALAAVWPNLWVIDGILQPEGLFAALVAFVLLAAHRLRDRPGLPRALVLGALIGAAALVRGEALAFVPLLAGAELVRRREPWRGRILRAGAVGVAAAVVIAPWFVRNLAQFEAPVPLSTNGNEVLYYANCPYAYEGPYTGFWSFRCQVEQRERVGEPPGDESERALYWRREGLDYARDHLGRVPVVVAARVGRVWDLYRPFQNAHLSQVEGRRSWVNRLGLFTYWAALPVAAYGLVVLRRRGAFLWPVVSCFALVTLTAAYAYGVVRFRIPAEVAIVVLCGVALDDAWTRWGPAGRARPGGAT